MKLAGKSRSKRAFEFHRRLSDILINGILFRPEWIVENDLTVVPMSNTQNMDDPWVVRIGPAILDSPWLTWEAVRTDSRETEVYSYDPYLDATSSLLDALITSPEILIASDFSRAILFVDVEYAFVVGDRRFVERICGDYDGALERFDQYAIEMSEEIDDSIFSKLVPLIYSGVRAQARLGNH